MGLPPLRRRRRRGRHPVRPGAGGGGLETGGLELTDDEVAELLRVDPDGWRHEADSSTSFFDTFGDRLPDELERQLEELDKRLAA